MPRSRASTRWQTQQPSGDLDSVVPRGVPNTGGPNAAWAHTGIANMPTSRTGTWCASSGDFPRPRSMPDGCSPGSAVHAERLLPDAAANFPAVQIRTRSGRRREADGVGVISPLRREGIPARAWVGTSYSSIPARRNKPPDARSGGLVRRERQDSHRVATTLTDARPGSRGCSA